VRPGLDTIFSFFLLYGKNICFTAASMMRGRGEWRKEKKEDMDRRSGILCTFFWRLVSALSLFLRKKQNQSFLAWYKNQEGRGKERKKNRLLGSRLPWVPVSRDRSGQCFVQEWARRGFFVCYTMGRGIRRKRLIGDAEGKEGWRCR
jgi:hypothetical protein